MGSMQEIEVVALQLPSQEDYRKNLDTLVRLVRKHQDKKLLVAPEVFLTAYDYAHIEEATDFSEKVLTQLQALVGDQILVLTMMLKEGDSYVNSAIVIHNHAVVYRQHKAKLFKLGEEDRYLAAGDTAEIKPFEIEGISFAIMICFEIRFKELWKQIEGVDIVLIPARWGLPRKEHLEILSRALAVMNQCYVIVANSSDTDMASSSAIISPNGDVVLDDSSNAIEATIDFREIKKMRRYIVME